MTRREAREHLFKLVFQTEFREDEATEDMLETYIQEGVDTTDLTQREDEEGNIIPPHGLYNYIKESYFGIKENLKQIDAYIEKYSAWDTGRISKTNLGLLRLGIYEIVFSEDIPNAVAVNEAVLLAKKYGEDKASAFVNGVLAKVLAEKSNENTDGNSDK